MVVRPSIRTARTEDWTAIADLLAECRLPVDDLNPAMLADFLVSERAGRIVGVVGSEPLGEDVLFRSLAVAPGCRGQGLAGALTAELERRARAGGATTAYLLTATAENFAWIRGFRVKPREEAPAAVRNTAEFRHVCCASARCMSKNL
mgnify:CR=1 FL=1